MELERNMSLRVFFTHAIGDVLQQERTRSQVIYGNVEESLNFLLMKVHSDDVCQTSLEAFNVRRSLSNPDLNFESTKFKTDALSGDSKLPRKRLYSSITSTTSSKSFDERLP